MEPLYFTFEIITPTTTTTHIVEWVEIESPTGSFLVGPQHSPLVSIIKNKSSIIYKNANAQTCTLDVSQGIFKVDATKAIALLDQ